MLAALELVLIELNGLGPAFALFFGVPDLRPFRRLRRLTVRSRRRVEIVVV